MDQSIVSEEAMLRFISNLDDGQRLELSRWGESFNGGMIGKLLTLSRKQPSAFDAIAADGLPDEPVLDYITDLDVRHQLLIDIRELLNEAQLPYKIDMAFVAVFMVAPIDMLRSRIRLFREDIRNNDPGTVHQFFTDCKGTVLTSIFGYVNKGGRRTASQSGSTTSLSINPSPLKRPRITHGRSLSYPDAPMKPISPLQPTMPPQPTIPSQPTTPHRPTTPQRSTTPHQPTTPHRQMASVQPTTPSLQVSPPPVQVSAHTSPQLPLRPPAVSIPSSGRNPAAAQLCKKRDNSRCIFTDYENPEAAHILPFSITKNLQTLNCLVALLRMFWGDNAANKLLTLVQDRNIIESPQNLLSLNHQLHSWFDSAKMALKPLRKLDDESVVVQFHWLKAGNKKPDLDVHAINLRDIVTMSGLHHDGWGSMLAHRASGLRLETGQVFILKANDPAHIPNFDLLQLSWDLLRIIAICGAAEEEDADDDDDIDDDGLSIDAVEGIYEANNGAEIYQWAAEVEMEEEGVEEQEEEHSVYGDKSPH
ncbi:hypothetical protein GGI43DRAFT_307968 [Trichoderma evansii]